MCRNDGDSKNLEDTLKDLLQPMEDIPFAVAIAVISGHKVLNLDMSLSKDAELLELLAKAASIAGERARKEGIFADRPNEAGNVIEKFVKAALNEVGLKADTPFAANGKRKATGYPDIEIRDKYNRTIYLECKTYNKANLDTTQRAFYFSPSENFKVTKDALHLMLSYELEKVRRKGRVAFVPVHWRLYSLENLTVNVKHEFNQNNRKLYGSQSAQESLLAEDDIAD